MLAFLVVPAPTIGDRVFWFAWRFLMALSLLLILFMSGLAFADSSGVTVTIPSINVPEIVLTVVAALFALWMKLGQTRAHQALQAIINDPKSSASAKAAATVGDKLETLVESAAGHALPLVQADVGAGKDGSTVTRDAANDLLDSLDAGVKAEVSAHFGQGGAALVDLVEGLIKSRVQAAQTAKLAAANAAGAVAAKAVATPQAAVAAVNG